MCLSCIPVMNSIQTIGTENWRNAARCPSVHRQENNIVHAIRGCAKSAAPDVLYAARIDVYLEADIVLRQTGPDDSVSLLVEQLKSQLSQREWFVLEGRYILGYSQEELGKLLGVNPNSVRMIICRARNKARDILYPANARGGLEHE